MIISLDDPRRDDVRELLAEHLRDMRRLSPAESVHALDVEALRTPDLSFFTARVDGVLYGCGALKELDPTHGELKSMRTPRALRRRGAGRAMLSHLLATARSRGYRRVSLETGTAPPFDAARTLYASAGFAPCGPFGDYRPDPHSAFYTLVL